MTQIQQIEKEIAPKAVNPVNQSANISAPFVQIPLEVVENLAINPGAFRLYVLLISYSRGFGACWPSQATLAAKLGVNERTIRNWLKQLESAGLVEIEHRCTLPGHEQSNIYHLKKTVAGKATAEQRTTAPTNRGNTIPPTPEKICHPPRQNFSAELHAVELHEVKYKHTHESQEKPEPEADNVCVPPQIQKKAISPEESYPKPALSGKPVETQVKQPASPKPPNPVTLEPVQAAQVAEVEEALKRHQVGPLRVRWLALKVVRANLGKEYIEQWAAWISQQQNIRNPGGFLAQVVEQLAPVPGQESNSPSAITVSPERARLLPRLIEIAQRDVRESRSETERQSAQTRLTKLLAEQAAVMQNQNQEKGAPNHATIAAAS